MSPFICPLCGESINCRKLHDGINGFEKFHCNTYHADYSLSNDIIFLSDKELKSKLLNLVVEHLIRSPLCTLEGYNSEWMFLYAPSSEEPDKLPANQVNLANQMKNYPTKIVDVANRSLINLSIVYPNYGQEFSVFNPQRRLLFEDITNDDFSNIPGTLRMIRDLGLVKTDDSYNYVIAAKGWEKVDELKSDELILKQGFIAMRFGDETKFIRHAFKKAIESCGFSAQVIDEKEHNNQIVPEILYEIARSKFMVVDITFPNYGAYYEAGYAQALGKEVIICCRKQEFHSDDRRPHFDIAQKSMIVWEDENDLIHRLKKRIQATVR